MPHLRGLTIVVAGGDADRMDAALTLAAASAALGARTRLYAHGAAVTRLDHPLMATARDLGVAVTACQTALADHAVALPGGVDGGGMVGLLADLGDDRLVMI